MYLGSRHEGFLLLESQNSIHLFETCLFPNSLHDEILSKSMPIYNHCKCITVRIRIPRCECAVRFLIRCNLPSWSLTPMTRRLAQGWCMDRTIPWSLISCSSPSYTIWQMWLIDFYIKHDQSINQSSSTGKASKKDNIKKTRHGKKTN